MKAGLNCMNMGTEHPCETSRTTRTQQNVNNKVGSVRAIRRSTSLERTQRPVARHKVQLFYHVHVRHAKSPPRNTSRRYRHPHAVKVKGENPTKFTDRSKPKMKATETVRKEKMTCSGRYRSDSVARHRGRWAAGPGGAVEVHNNKQANGTNMFITEGVA